MRHFLKTKTNSRFSSSTPTPTLCPFWCPVYHIYFNNGERNKSTDVPFSSHCYYNYNPDETGFVFSSCIKIAKCAIILISMWMKDIHIRNETQILICNYIIIACSSFNVSLTSALNRHYRSSEHGWWASNHGGSILSGWRVDKFLALLLLSLSAKSKLLSNWEFQFKMFSTS